MEPEEKKLDPLEAERLRIANIKAARDASRVVKEAARRRRAQRLAPRLAHAAAATERANTMLEATKRANQAEGVTDPTRGTRGISGFGHTVHLNKKTFGRQSGGRKMVAGTAEANEYLRRNNMGVQLSGGIIHVGKGDNPYAVSKTVSNRLAKMKYGAGNPYAVSQTVANRLARIKDKLATNSGNNLDLIKNAPKLSDAAERLGRARNIQLQGKGRKNKQRGGFLPANDGMGLPLGRYRRPLKI